MANPRAQFERAKWNLDLLSPFWALQLILAMSMAGMFSWRLAEAVQHAGDEGHDGQTAELKFAWQGINIVMATASAACTLFEMTRLVGEVLTPWALFLTHLVKMACASIVLAVDIVVVVVWSGAHYSLVGLALDAALIISTAALTVYAGLTHRRLSAYDDYTRPFNVKGYGFSDGLDCAPASARRFSLHGASEKRASTFSSSRVSLASVASTASDTAERPAGHYSHRRDTQFDEYVARRSSHAARPDAGALEPTVAVAVAMPIRMLSRGVSAGRAASYGSDLALVAVPEEEPAEGPLETDQQQALLGRSRRSSSSFVEERRGGDDEEGPWREGGAQHDDGFERII